MLFYLERGFLHGEILNHDMKIFIPNSFSGNYGVYYIYTDPDYFKDDAIDLIDRFIKEIDIYHDDENY